MVRHRKRYKLVIGRGKSAYHGYTNLDKREAKQIKRILSKYHRKRSLKIVAYKKRR